MIRLGVWYGDGITNLHEIHVNIINTRGSASALALMGAASGGKADTQLLLSLIYFSKCIVNGL